MAGKVLVVDGTTGGSAELYNPATNAWTAAAPPDGTRMSATGTLLAGGKVLVAGGYDPATGDRQDAELYDAATDTWSPAGTLNLARHSARPALLANGKVDRLTLREHAQEHGAAHG